MNIGYEMPKSEVIFKCRLQRANEATCLAKQGNDKKLWLKACPLWERALEDPNMSKLSKRLYEATFVNDFKEWLAKGNKW